MSVEQNIDGNVGQESSERFIKVSIATTAGFFPSDGFNLVPENQKLEVELQRANDELGIKDTAGWVASVNTPDGKRPLDPAKSYKGNGLFDEVEIDWGPTEGGGGNAPGSR